MPITATQLEQRKTRIGSSDMAAILGLDPRRNAYDVWLEKTGKLEDDLTSTGPMYAGNMFEDGVLNYAEQELGKLTRNQFRSAKDRGIPLGANIDAILVQTGQPVEAKTAGLFGPIRETWGEPGTDAVPDRVLIQAQVHMICSLSEVCHIAAFLGGRGFQMFVVPRDPVVADVVTETAVQFWEKNVLGDTPPDDTLPQASTLKRVRREPETFVDLEYKLIEDWLFAKEKVKSAEDLKQDAEIAMLTALGQAEGGQCPQGRLTYLSQSRASVDAKALKAEHPDIYERYLRTSVYRVPRWKLNK